MYQEEIQVSYGEGRYQIHISSIITGSGISVTITGGEKPHVGGVAMSVPRKSLAGDKISCDTWVCPVPGHKDTEVAVPVAELICLETGNTVAVVAGIHIDRAEEREIQKLVENSLEAASLLIKQIKS
ncbi:MAG: prenylated flavin chaperone LpdD [Eubacteriales bacterium]